MSESPKKQKLEQSDFTGGAIHALSPYRGSTGDDAIDAQITELAQRWGCRGNEELVEELIVTALKIGHDDVRPAELKLWNRALKELRAANRVFHKYQDVRKVATYGSARTQPGKPEHDAAIEFGRKMAEREFMMITGAGDGIMGAAQAGAGREMGFGLNISLPFEQGANETIEGDDKLIMFNYFFTRKLSFVKEAHAAALFPGGFGTMDEGFEVLTLIQTGKASIYPIVAIDAPGGSYWKTWEQFLREHLLRLGLVSESDFHLFHVTDDIDWAVDHILHFYKNFHSYRWMGKQLVIRLNEKLTRESVRRLNDDFADLLISGEIVQGDALEGEANETEIADLPRLILNAQQRDYGRLRQLIDAINDSYREKA